MGHHHFGDHCCSHSHGGANGCGEHHHHDSCCDHSHHHCGCCGSSSCSEHGSSDKGSTGDVYIQLADKAWLNVLQRKMEKILEHQVGEHLDRVAEFVCEANKNRWKGIFSKNHCIEHYHEGLRKLFEEDIACKDHKKK